jgi:hypothetical protein
MTISNHSTRWALAVGLWAIVISGSVPARGTARLTLRVHPSVSMAPSTFVIAVSIEPDERNRRLTITVDDGGFYRSSSFDLSGANEAHSLEVVFKSIPEGEYVITAKLEGSDGPLSEVNAHATVVGASKVP